MKKLKEDILTKKDYAADNPTTMSRRKFQIDRATRKILNEAIN